MTAVVRWLEREYAAAKKRATAKHKSYLRVCNKLPPNAMPMDAAWARMLKEEEVASTIRRLLRKARKEAAK